MNVPNLALALGLLSSTLIGVALAAAFSPDATAQGLPATPDPAECMVTPRSLEELRGLAAISATPPAATIAARATAPLVGRPADPATVAAVSATVREYYACVNAGDVLALLALHSDDLVQRQFAELPPNLLRTTLDFLATPTPMVPPQIRIALVGVREVQILADGRVGAVVEVTLPPAFGGGRRQDYGLFVDEGGRYRIDGGTIGVLDGDPPGTATPRS